MERNPSFSLVRVFFVFCLILSFVIAAATNNIITDQDALLALRAHITHDPSNFLDKNWNTSTSVCNWTRVTCDINLRRVIALNVSHLSLAGTIPSQLGNLSSLQTLDLSFNRLSGPIPPSIFGIHTLKFLDLSDNQLSSSFSSLISNMSSLQFIDLNNNRISSELPADVCDYFPYLEIFYLTGNMLHGEIPSTLSKCKQLQRISFTFNQFSGIIPKEIGNLTKHKELFLGYNKLQGEIPQELGNLAELESLSLTNNLLTGTIPSCIFNLSSLSLLDFSKNNLMGTLPEDIRLPHIKIFFLAYNQITGRIPRDIGNLTWVKIFLLGSNNLIGEIPHEIVNLQNLEYLGLENNSLSGVVPATIFNMSTAKHISLMMNTLSGSLPSSIDFQLPNLEKLYLSNNNFSGAIPSSIFNASKLTLLEMRMNSFTGFIPSTFGNFKNLEWLALGYNYLRSSTPNLSFLSSLGDCKNLEILELTGNPLDGILPISIGNLSTSLEYMYMIECNISGRIPEEITNLFNLTTLSLGGNKLTGSIPVTLARLQKLQGLYLYDNKLEGSIPVGLCKLSRLVELNLCGNKLSGSIPICLGNLTSLRVLLLDSNELSSVIPSTFWNLKDILVFNFSSNSLNGTLPLNIGNLKVVVSMDLSWNSLSGYIPTTIGGLRNLANLSLAYNRLQGPIPTSFGELVSMEFLDLSSNNLSGAIPVSLKKLSYLKYLNLSFNSLEGEIPEGGSFANFSARSFMGNSLLCSSPNLKFAPCKSTSRSSSHRRSRKKVRLLAIVMSLSIVLVIAMILAIRLLVVRCRKRSTGMVNEEYMSPQATWRRFSYHELSQATDGFSESNLLGIGSFGSVYKASLRDGMEVAVKVFHLQNKGAFKSFDAEFEVMSRIRHRNLVKIISSCSNDDFKALLLEYMPNGSLEECLYAKKCILGIIQRLNVMIDVASALEYLHFGHSTPIVHCDIKPSNVLLEKNMVAHLSDFGIAKFLSGEDQLMTQTQTLATVGYMAPEYGIQGQVSAKGDVYGYGIMLMEIFTKKKPTDKMFAEEKSLKR